MKAEHLSRRVQGVKPSRTLVIAARAVQLRKEGREVASLSVGEPDFPVFPHVAQAIVQALEAGHTKYTPSAGIPALREAIAAWMQRETGLRYEPLREVIACAGAKQALSSACLSLLDEGDEAVIPNPGWVSYPDMVRLAGGVPVELRLMPEDGWLPRPEVLARALSARTRLVFLGSPANPTGAVCDEATLAALAVELRKHPRAIILCDDIYGRLVYGGAKVRSLLQVAPDLRDRTLLVNGCSKAYAMTGLRLGWACGPAELVGAMVRVQDALTSNPSSLSQHAAIAALNGPQELVEEMRRVFEARRELALRELAAAGVPVVAPAGAYYLFCDVGSFLGRKLRGAKVETSERLAELLLEEHGVAVVPGSAFGREGYLRLSFASSDDELRKGLSRLRQGLAALEQ